MNHMAEQPASQLGSRRRFAARENKLRKNASDGEKERERERAERTDGRTDREIDFPLILYPLFLLFD